MAGERENNRNKLALAESMYEIQELKKEVDAKNEVVSEKVKLNTLLKEELIVKDKIIRNLKENNEDTEQQLQKLAIRFNMLEVLLNYSKTE